MKNKNYEISPILAKGLYENKQALENFSYLTNEQRLKINEQVNKSITESEIQRIVQNIADGFC